MSAFDAVTQLADDIRANVCPVHALDNLAGVIHAGLLADSQMADLDRLIRVDLLGTVAYSRAFLPQLVACGHGQLVTVSSPFGLTAAPGYAAYAAAKFGIPGFTKAVQQEPPPGERRRVRGLPRRHPNQHHATRHPRELRRPRGDPAPIQQLHRTNLNPPPPHPARGPTR